MNYCHLVILESNEQDSLSNINHHMNIHTIGTAIETENVIFEYGFCQRKFNQKVIVL